MFDDEEENKKMGILQYMLILQQAHLRGYQKLRWLSESSPSGMSVRCHITTGDNIVNNKEIRDFENPNRCSTAVWQLDGGDTRRPEVLFQLFASEHRELLRSGIGRDPDYVQWFNGLVEKAREGKVPLFYYDYWNVPEGWIKVGDEFYPCPPPFKANAEAADAGGGKLEADDRERLDEVRENGKALDEVRENKESAAEAYFSECRVAGLQYRDVDEVLEELAEGDRLALVREHGNKHDANAVAIACPGDYDENDPDGFDFACAIGYVPREDNKLLAKMMDLGCRFSAKVTEVKRSGPYSDRLHIAIYVIIDYKPKKVLSEAELIDIQLEKALKIAVEAHFGQRDKGGRPYIFHPLRVAARCTGKAKVAALLHDTVEDTSVTFEGLALQGIDDDVIAALRLLTHDKSVPYLDYVRKVKDNPIAREVKMSDLQDNMNLTRLKTVTDVDLQRVKKYHEAYKMLEEG